MHSSCITKPHSWSLDNIVNHSRKMLYTCLFAQCERHKETLGDRTYRFAAKDMTLNFIQSAWRYVIFIPMQWQWIMHADVTFMLWGFCFQHGRRNSCWIQVDLSCEQCQYEGFWTKTILSSCTIVTVHGGLFVFVAYKNRGTSANNPRYHVSANFTILVLLQETWYQYFCFSVVRCSSKPQVSQHRIVS